MTKNKNLILTRKIGERVKITTPRGEICTVTVTNLTPTQCKLGFQADSSVRIDREEVYSKKEIFSYFEKLVSAFPNLLHKT